MLTAIAGSSGGARLPERKLQPLCKILHPQKSKYDQFNSKIKQFSNKIALFSYKNILFLNFACGGLFQGDRLMSSPDSTPLEILHPPPWNFALYPLCSHFTHTSLPRLFAQSDPQNNPSLKHTRFYLATRFYDKYELIVSKLLDFWSLSLYFSSVFNAPFIM